MKMLRIKNWDKYQHYKTRGTPPWVKLHVKIINSDEWIKATDACKLSMICCLIVGAMHEGCVPDDSVLIKDKCHIDWRVDLKALLSLGFLEEMLADASTPLADASTRELRSRDTEEERESQSALASAPPPDGGAPASLPGKKQKRAAAPPPAGFDEFYAAYPKKMGKTRAVKAYAKAIKKVTFTQMMLALENQILIWKKDSEYPTYVRYPATWLNDEAWNEEVVKLPERTGIL